MDVVQSPFEQVGIFQVRKNQGQDLSFTPEGIDAQKNFFFFNQALILSLLDQCPG